LRVQKSGEAQHQLALLPWQLLHHHPVVLYQQQQLVVQAL
jgi:hypothetical protein